jgi:hypothetical protein
MVRGRAESGGQGGGSGVLVPTLHITLVCDRAAMTVKPMMRNKSNTANVIRLGSASGLILPVDMTEPSTHHMIAAMIQLDGSRGPLGPTLRLPEGCGATGAAGRPCQRCSGVLANSADGQSNDTLRRPIYKNNQSIQFKLMVFT